jgi:hypothetical protein
MALSDSTTEKTIEIDKLPYGGELLTRSSRDNERSTSKCALIITGHIVINGLDRNLVTPLVPKLDFVVSGSSFRHRRHPRATRSEGVCVLELAVVHVAGFSVTQRDAKDVDASWCA